MMSFQVEGHMDVLEDGTPEEGVEALRTLLHALPYKSLPFGSS